MGALACVAFTLLPLAALSGLCWLLWQHDLPLTGSLPWMEGAGVAAAWRIDGLSALFLLMITGVGTAVFVYAGGYLAGHRYQQRLYTLLTLFMLAMIGCVTADNLIFLFVFWELTSLTSFLLVGFNHEEEKSRKSAQQALLVTGSGGLVLLAGFLTLGHVAGTYEISQLVRTVPDLPASPALTTAMLLIVIGCFTKSAQFPFHFWLPNAMAAPTPVSAYLHSATMVKLGIYLMARLDPAFGHDDLWATLLMGAGSVTAAWGMTLALRERDLKRILAWSTVATLGTLTMLIGIKGSAATVAVAALLLAHALYKAPLFFVAGNIDHGTGTRIIDKLGGLRHAMPWTALAAVLAGMSMAGMPLSFGYVVKDVISEVKNAEDVLAFARAANTLFGAIALAVAGVAAIRVFWRHPGINVTPPDAHEGNPAMVLPPLTLAAIGIFLGLMPAYADTLVAQAAQAMTGAAMAPEPGLAPNWGHALSAMGVALVVGALIFWFWDPLHRFMGRFARPLDTFGMPAQYERMLKAIPAGAAALTRGLQHGEQPAYLATVIGFSTVLLLGVVGAVAGELSWPAWDAVHLGGAAALVMICLGGLFACALRNRLVLLLTSGLVGYGSAVFFLFSGAPDLAFTQFTVETVFVVVVAGVLLRLKRIGHAASLNEPRWRPGAALLAAGFGLALTALLMLALGHPFDPALTQYFSEHSVPDAHGRNVVNVILVDFRALDTMGEVAVVALSFLAALPLLGLLRDRQPAKESR
ncbi:hydrogen gas-evolving membrane-bound hydrogenase subunit E [Aquabacterium fontiphilum]|jgi:multicomponent Na+:H+ antiporter subunit A|uniref:hydrogen gas-evolving membrane-bound hydrogenase subunit E n=1 Tax=Aquabacterium fontiphilum TaxID=450365 RepID=UPI001F3FD5DF|nr:hydrogen gas-evolving membrane-bound hydrogenase subunit E [Aquabacterium fontiphilum]